MCFLMQLTGTTHSHSQEILFLTNHSQPTSLQLLAVVVADLKAQVEEEEEEQEDCLASHLKR
jgi:hypothetical protein